MGGTTTTRQGRYLESGFNQFHGNNFTRSGSATATATAATTAAAAANGTTGVPATAGATDAVALLLRATDELG